MNQVWSRCRLKKPAVNFLSGFTRVEENDWVISLLESVSFKKLNNKHNVVLIVYIIRSYGSF